MPRKPRIHFPGALYHVMLRGNRGDDIFYSRADRTRFLLLIQAGIQRFRHRVHAYCLMDNHVHLAMQVDDVPLAKIMQNLSFRYTQYFNQNANDTFVRPALEHDTPPSPMPPHPSPTMKLFYLLAITLAFLLGGCALAPHSEDRPIVHAIGVYEGTYPPGVRHSHGYHPFGEVRITVATKTPIALILSAYEPVNWVFDLHDGAQVRQVVLNGYHPDRVSGLLDGTVVLREHFGAVYKADHKVLVDQYAMKKFGVKPASFQYGYQGRDFIINRF